MYDTLPLAYELHKVSTLKPSCRYDGNNSFLEWQTKSRDQLRSLLGLPFESCEEDLQIDGERDTEKFHEIRFKFQSEKGYYVPCVLRVPAGKSAPLPVFICLQGHSTGMHISLGEPKYDGDADSIRGGDRAFAVRVVEEGFCALTLEQRGMGIRGGNENGPQCHVPAMTSLLIGRTMIGERVWDISRAIDVLEKHFPQVDSAKVLCLGNSGGGTATFYAACMDERIKGAVPSCAVCTYKASIAAQYHCVCNFIPNIASYFDMGDLAGLIAPRFLLVVAGREDPIFPIGGVMETDKVIAGLYKAAGCPARYKLVIGEGGHRFYADAAWKELHKLLKTI